MIEDLLQGKQKQNFLELGARVYEGLEDYDSCLKCFQKLVLITKQKKYLKKLGEMYEKIGKKELYEYVINKKEPEVDLSENDKDFFQKFLENKTK